MTKLYHSAKSERYKRHHAEQGLCEMCTSVLADGDKRFCQMHRKKLREARRLRGKIKRAGGAVM